MEEAKQLGLDLYENKARAVVGETNRQSSVYIHVCTSGVLEAPGKWYGPLSS